MSRFKLQENIDKYLKFMEFVKSASPHTLRHYKLDLEQVFGATLSLGKNDKKSHYTEAELLVLIRSCFSERWSQLSLASRNRKAATLKSFFSWAFQEELTERDLSLQITCPKVPKKIPHFLSVDEALSVLTIFKRKDLDEMQNEVLFLLLYGAGLRVSEACQLRWNEINFSQKSIRVLGKGNKERLLILPERCLLAMKALQKNISGDFVFGEAPLSTRKAYEMIRQSGKKAGLLKSLHPHALRHSFATHLLTSGANLRTLQAMLGHESLQATEKYTHLGVDQLARTLEKMHPLGRGRKAG